MVGRFALSRTAAAVARVSTATLRGARSLFRQGQPDPDHAAAVLRKTYQQLRMAEQIAGMGYWRLTIPDHQLEWSPEVYRIYGLEPTPGGVSLATAIEAYHPDDQADVARVVEETIANASSYSSQWRLMRPDGEIRHVMARGTVECDPSGRVLSLFGVFLDVTEERRAQEAAAAAQAELQAVTQQARESAEASNESLHRLARHLERALGRAEAGSQAKSRFLAGMSHELRTPLNGILGYAQLLQMEGGLNPTQHGRVGSMLDAGRHLLEMINRVLDLSEVEAGRMELQRIDFDLRATASLCLDFVRPAAVVKRLALSLVLADGLPARMIGDPTRLRQVLLNLLGNAVKFTPAGAVELHLAPSSGGARLRIEVSDTGPGIAPDRRHLLFHDFARLEDAGKATEGAGLGLSISAQIVVAMGGTLGHADHPAGGSIFWLELPLDGTAQRPAAAEAAPASPVLRGLRVLVVDDVEMNRTIVEGFLRAAGHQVDCVAGGAEAVDAVSRAEFDLVFMDVRMPGMDGLEATRRIRALDPASAAARVPIVALTAQAFGEQIEECRRAGMDGHLSKPFTPQTLAAATQEGIETARRRCHPPAKATPLLRSTHAEPDGLAVFDAAALDRIAGFMTPHAVTAHLNTLAAKAAELRQALAGSASLGAMVVDNAHALAGSAGLFGFLQLARSCRRLEQAVRDDSPDQAVAATDVTEQVDTAMRTIRGLAPPAQAATPEPAMA